MEGNDKLAKILQFSIMGMAEEIQKMQNRIVLQERFGSEAVLFTSSSNVLRSNTDDSFKKRIDSCNSLIQLMKQTTELLEKIRDQEREQFASWFKSQNT